MYEIIPNSEDLLLPLMVVDEPIKEDNHISGVIKK